MLKISKDEINKLIKETKYQNAGKISHDYVLPLPERPFGSDYEGKKKWSFDVPKPKGESDIQAWINRVNRYNEKMGVKIPTPVEMTEEATKEKRRQEKLQLLQQLIARLGPVGAAPVAAPIAVAPPVPVAPPPPVPAPAPVPTPARASVAAPVRMPPQREYSEPVPLFPDISSTPVRMPIRMPASAPILSNIGTSAPITTFEEQVNPQSYMTQPKFSDDEIKEILLNQRIWGKNSYIKDIQKYMNEGLNIEESLTELATREGKSIYYDNINWNDKTYSRNISTVLREKFFIIGNKKYTVDKIITYFKQNPADLPESFSVAYLKSKITSELLRDLNI